MDSGIPKRVTNFAIRLNRDDSAWGLHANNRREGPAWRVSSRNKLIIKIWLLSKSFFKSPQTFLSIINPRDHGISFSNALAMGLDIFAKFSLQYAIKIEKLFDIRLVYGLGISIKGFYRPCVGSDIGRYATYVRRHCLAKKLAHIRFLFTNCGRLSWGLFEMEKTAESRWSFLLAFGLICTYFSYILRISRYLKRFENAQEGYVMF